MTTSQPFQNQFPLDAISEDDKPLVRDVLVLLSHIKICSSWSADPLERFVEIHGIIEPSKRDQDIDLRELVDSVQALDRYRVSYLALRNCGSIPMLIIRILKRSEPIFIEELDLVKIKRKRPFWRI
jgi:hypothetical protein